jgi:hypothetical protein
MRRRRATKSTAVPSTNYLLPTTEYLLPTTYYYCLLPSTDDYNLCTEDADRDFAGVRRTEYVK